MHFFGIDDESIYTVLLYIINFIIIFSLIKLIINKYSKHRINKFTYNNDSVSYLEKMVIRFINIVVGLNLFFLFFYLLELDSLIVTIGMSIICIIDIIAAILLGIFAKIQGSLKDK